MKRKCLAQAACPIARSLETVGDWWSLLIVRDALQGRRRFGEFQKSLGLAKNILAVRLKKLVAEGVLELVPASDGSAYKEYVLTDAGRELVVVLLALQQWAARHLFQSQQGNCAALVDRRDGQPLPLLEVRAHDGRVLGPDDIDTAPSPRTAVGAV